LDLDPDALELLQAPEQRLQSLLAEEESLREHAAREQGQEQHHRHDEPAPPHHSTCVMLRWTRGFLPDSDSACATSRPISSIGSFQRTPTPTEYSSGVSQSVNALPASKKIAPRK